VGENCYKKVGTATEFIPHPMPTMNLPKRKIYRLSNVKSAEPKNKQTSASSI
jgi:hypothetical protein